MALCTRLAQFHCQHACITEREELYDNDDDDDYDDDENNSV